MARPLKKGVDYFPLDVNLDQKMMYVLSRFGMKGFGIVIRLFQKIYGEEGFFMEWSQDVALLFNYQNGLSGDVVSEVVTECIRRGIFDKGMYEKHSILTSKGIQERYLMMIKRRGEPNIKKAYSLLSDAEIHDIDDNNGINDDNNSINELKNSTNKIKLKNNNVQSEWFESFYQAYPRKQSKKIAERKFMTICKTESMFKEIMDGLNNWIGSKDWSDKQYIPHPSTFLNQERWKELPLDHNSQKKEEWLHL